MSSSGCYTIMALQVCSTSKFSLIKRVVRSLSTSTALLLAENVSKHVQISSRKASPSPVFQVFDRDLVTRHRNRAASDPLRSRLTDYVKDEVAANMVDRLLDIRRRFPVVTDLGSGPGFLVKHLDNEITQKIVMADSSVGMLYRDEAASEVSVERVVVNEEILPWPIKSLDVVMSCLSMHWINDLPGTLTQVRQQLKEDAPFIGAMFGGDTLFELRTSIQLAELEREGGFAPHISPMTDSQSLTSLLNRAGFTLSTVDVDEITVAYPSIFELIDDLRWMGESNAVLNARRMPKATKAGEQQIKDETLFAAAAIYKELHGLDDGTIPATFQIMHMIGWAPGPDQPKPAARGSGKVSLADALGDGAAPSLSTVLTEDIPRRKK